MPVWWNSSKRLILELVFKQNSGREGLDGVPSNNNKAMGFYRFEVIRNH